MAGLQTAKTARRLGEKPVPRANGLDGNEIGLRHLGNDAADIVKGLGGGGHRGTRQNGLHKRAPLDAVRGFVARVKGDFGWVIARFAVKASDNFVGFQPVFQGGIDPCLPAGAT